MELSFTWKCENVTDSKGSACGRRAFSVVATAASKCRHGEREGQPLMRCFPHQALGPSNQSLFRTRLWSLVTGKIREVETGITGSPHVRWMHYISQTFLPLVLPGSLTRCVGSWLLWPCLQASPIQGNSIPASHSACGCPSNLVSLCWFFFFLILPIYNFLLIY